MQTFNLKTLAVVLGILTFTSANAHDPSEHKDSAEKPKCEMMENMDHSKMDSNDPVMQAMMEKCKASHKGKMEGKGMMEHHADDAQGDAQHQDKMQDKMKNKGMMGHDADDSKHHDKMKGKMKDKGMMENSADEDSDHSEAAEEHDDDAHSDDHN